MHNLKIKDISHDFEEASVGQELSGFPNNVGDGCISRKQSNQEVVSPNHDFFVEADTELVNENTSDNKIKETETPEGQKTAGHENSNVTTEKRPFTCFTIDAILNKRDDQKNFNTDNSNDTRSFIVNNNSIEQHNDFKTCMKSEIFKDDFEMTTGRNSCVDSTSFKDHQQETSNACPSRDSGVFIDQEPNDPISTRHFLWMSPYVTPFFPLHPFTLSNVSPTSLTGFCSVSPTTTTGFSCFPTPHGNLPVEYFMFDHNESDLKEKTWEPHVSNY